MNRRLQYTQDYMLHQSTMHLHPKDQERVQRLVTILLADIKHQASDAFLEVLESIPIRVKWDSPEHNRFGDFFGVPLDKGPGLDQAPADIILYARPLLQHANGDEEKLLKQTKETLMHEIGHYLGYNHQELKERGWD